MGRIPISEATRKKSCREEEGVMAMASWVGKKVKREKVGPMKCHLCNEPPKEPTSISPCLHTFCRKCIYAKLSNGGVNGCPVCEIGLACVSPSKLRLEHNLQDIISNIFPSKRRKIETLDVFRSTKVNSERSITSLVINTPIVPLQVTSIVFPPTEKVATNREIMSIDWQKCSALKKRRLEDVNYYYLSRNLSFHDILTRDFKKPKLDLACRWIQKAIPPELSKQIMKNSFPDIFRCIIYFLTHLLDYNRAPVSDRFEVIELTSHFERCGEYDENLAKIVSDHESKLKEHADFYEAKLKEQAHYYEAKLKEQAHYYEAKIKSLENNVVEKDKVQEESHRAGMEEGVRRVVRAIHAAAPYVEWDRIHISEDTIEEDRLSLHRAYAEGIISSSSAVTRDEDHGHVIIF